MRFYILLRNKQEKIFLLKKILLKEIIAVFLKTGFLERGIKENDTSNR